MTRVLKQQRSVLMLRDTYYMNEIIPGLFLGGFLSTADKEGLAEHEIKTVLGLGLNSEYIKEPDYKKMHIDIEDKVECSILEHLGPASDFIERGMQDEGNVLVHCWAGISRSASCVIAYLMKYKGLSLADATNLARERRKQVCPNSQFCKDLE